jgi:thiamine biosynthesis lipoprotein
MQQLADTMSRYRPGSAVQALAAHAGRAEPVRVPAELASVLQAAHEVSAFSDGAFDITVGAYRDWHFGSDRGAAPSIVPPATLHAQHRFVGWRRVELDAARGTARLPVAGMAIDLGGIAKLPILEAGLQALRAEGVGDAMIDGGGDVLCAGRLLGRAWRVGIRDPREPARLAGVVQVGDGIVASSGDYERFFDADGRRWHHVLDPASGLPTRGVHGVALIADDVRAVNGLGTAIMVAGLDAGRAMLQRRPAVDALIAGDSATWRSPGMDVRLAS